jgi:tetratricopeptide (TPR) repeat protein
MVEEEPGTAFATLPDPGQAVDLDELVEQLRLLKVWAGDPSYDAITARINSAWTEAGRPASELARRTTVADCFRSGRRRLNAELAVAVVQALHPDEGYVAQWRQALRVITGEAQASAQVRVQDKLPQDLAGFTGRSAELDRLRAALSAGGGAVVISAIEGMAGVGKTQLAVHAAHLLADEESFDQLLFVNLRGFHPDPAQPPADPAAVLDGFLRLLGMSGHEIPAALDARVTAYRDRLAATRALVVLDNAADEDQVRPLLPQTRGSVALVTSRRHLEGLDTAVHLPVDVFSPAEAVEFLKHAVAGVEVGQSPDAAARIAARCGYLPLALGLVAGYIRSVRGWTLTDHADRLDERHDDRRLETGVELALDVSYRQLPDEPRRLLRLASQHPGQEFDAYAVAALTGGDLETVEAQLEQLYRDHLLQLRSTGRYTFHDLVRAYATVRAADEEPRPVRRAALTRLFDYYLAAGIAAMDTLYPAAMSMEPWSIESQAQVPTMPTLEAALAWLDTERPTLTAVASYAAVEGWPTHTTNLSVVLFPYLQGYAADALIIHGHASQTSGLSGSLTDQGTVMTSLGTTTMQTGRYEVARENFQEALELFRQADYPGGESRVLISLGVLEKALGRYELAAELFRQGVPAAQRAGNTINEATALNGVAIVDDRLGRYESAVEHFERALALHQVAGNHTGQANVLSDLGLTEARLGRYASAEQRLHSAIDLARQIGNRVGEALALDNLGMVLVMAGRPEQALESFRMALVINRDMGERDGEAWNLNGLGEASHLLGNTEEAAAHHTAAYELAVELGSPEHRARAHAGFGQIHHTQGDSVRALEHYRQAIDLYAELGLPEADQIRERAAAVEQA